MTGWCAANRVSHQLVGVPRFLGLVSNGPYCELIGPAPQRYRAVDVGWSYGAGYNQVVEGVRSMEGLSVKAG